MRSQRQPQRRQHHQRPPLEPGRVYGEFVNAGGTTFVLRASGGGERMTVRLHHDEGPEIAVVCRPADPSERLIRWQGRLWSSNPVEWKREFKRLAFASIDAALGRCGGSNDSGDSDTPRVPGRPGGAVGEAPFSSGEEIRP